MKLTTEQMAQLQVEIAKQESVGHYGDAYAYLRSVIPTTGDLGPINNAVFTREEANVIKLSNFS